MGETNSQGLDRVTSLADPVRRELYAYVVGRPEPVSRDEAAEAAGIARTLAAYHLDKLAQAGLLTTSYQRPEGRRGPGAGRPAKLYAKAADEIAFSVPPRDYALLARVLVTAVEKDGDTVRPAVHEAARATGRAAGREAGDALTGLRRCGYQPHVDADGVIELQNCPFHQVAREHPAVVCGLNLHFVKGILAGAGQSVSRARLDPQPSRCCVTIAAERKPAV